MTFHRFTSFSLSLLFSLPIALGATSASAQGSVAPSTPPPLPPADGPGTPNQPPPSQPPPVSTARPAPPPADGPRSEDEEGEARSDGPPGRRGFQIAIRPGVAIPMGSLIKDYNLSDFASPQFAATVDIGAKIIPALFIGGYLGLNAGGAGGKQSDLCTKNGATCTALTLRIGVEAMLHIIPDGKIDPWVGYGIGYEATSLSESANGVSVNATAGGVEFAHLMAGVDFRFSKVFGVGPFADFALGQYSSVNNGNTSASIDTSQKALHEWLTIGVKFTFFP